MCGFIAAFSQGPKIEESQLRLGLNNLNHRGPDGQGVWIHPEKTVALGHVRLSIIDLNNGSQPLVSEDGSLVAVVNGEFYDYKKIRSKLKSKGFHFKTQSDSEILLGLYHFYGVKALEELRGEYAFVLWDNKRKSFFVGRDRFGIKPLYYTYHNQTLYFSSEMKGLIPFQVPFEFNHESVLSLGLFSNSNQQIFKSFKQLAPAHFIQSSLKELNLQQNEYWDFPYRSLEEDQQDQRSESEILEGFNELFTESIQLRLTADVPVGSYLSGGLDSCAILGRAQKLSSKGLKAFTLTFEENDLYNEFDQAKEMAEFCGAEFSPIAISQERIADHFADAVWVAERPLFNGHVVAKYLLSQAVNQNGMKVVMTGEGSDEIFGGYVHFREDTIQHHLSHLGGQQQEKLLSSLKDSNAVSQGLLSSNLENSEFSSFITQQLGFVPGWMKSTVANASRLLKLAKNPEQDISLLKSAYGNFLGEINLKKIKPWDPVHQAMYLWSKSFLPAYLLTVLGDRMEMAHSVEGRLPFLDHKLVEYVVQVPLKFKINNLTEKYLLREALKQDITTTIYNRQKHPFLAPPALSSKKNKMSLLINDTLRSENIKNMGIFDSQKIIQALDQIAKMDLATQNSMDIVLTALTSICIIHQKFKS